MGGICNPPVIGSGTLPIIGGGPDRVLFENAAQILDTDSDFRYTAAPVAPDFTSYVWPTGGGAAFMRTDLNNFGMWDTGGLAGGGSPYWWFNAQEFRTPGFFAFNNLAGDFEFQTNSVPAGRLKTSGDWWFGASDPGGTAKVRVNGNVSAPTAGSELSLGTTSTLAAAGYAGVNMNGATGGFLNFLGAGTQYGLVFSSFAGLTIRATGAASTLSFDQNGVVAGTLTAARDWWFGAADPGGGAKVRVNGAASADTVFATGTTVPTSGSGALLAYIGGSGYVYAVTLGGAYLPMIIGGLNVQVFGPLYPSNDAGVQQTVAAVRAGNGAPSNANGADGDFYFRGDGGAGTFIYHKAAGAWAAFA